MPCPMRVVYATFIAAVLAAWGLLDMLQAQEEFDAQMQGATGEAGRPPPEPQGLRQQLRTHLNPLALLRRLHQRPIMLALLIFLHMELLVTKFRMSKAILGEEALDALIASSAPLQAVHDMLPSLPWLAGDEQEVPAVVAGTGCYFKMRGCSYELAVCCRDGCEAAGGMWIAGPGADPRAPKGIGLGGCTSGAGGCAVTDCGVPAAVTHDGAVNMADRPEL
jgi:hypothetical protein